MKLLITGHKGFIGGNAYKHFVKEHEVDGYEWDENNPPNLDKGYDWVLHFGAISSTTERDIAKIMRQNYDFSCWLLSQCNARGINLQYSSSASVYGANSSFKETDPVDPRTPYAWSKYLFDRHVSKKTLRIKVQGFRYFNVFGPGEAHKKNQASPHYQFTEQAKFSRSIKVFENSDKYFRDFVPVERVIEIHEKFLTIDKSGLWNVGTGVATSFMDVACEIGTKYPSIIETIPMPEELKYSYQFYTCADLTSLNEALQI